MNVGHLGNHETLKVVVKMSVWIIGKYKKE